MDESRDDRARAEEGGGDEGTPEAPRSPFEPPRDDEGAVPPPDPEAEPPVEREARPGDDVFDRLNSPPAGEDVEAEPPFVVKERDLGLSEEPKAPSKAATFVAFAVVVMAVLGILTTVATVRLYMERAEMSAALDQSVNRLSAVYAGPQSSDTSKRRIGWLQESVNEGDFAQAQKAIEALGAPEVDRPSPLDLPGGDDDGASADNGENGGERPEGLPSPRQDKGLPVEAQAFFEQHPKLWEAFFGFSVGIERMKRAEVPVEEFTQLREQMVEAAQQGDAKKVESLLRRAQESLAGQSANQMPQALREKLQQFGQAMQQAQKERRDVRAAVALAKKSERAAQQGDLQRAERLMDQAIAALKDAPHMRAPQRASGPSGARGRAPQMGPQIGFLKFLAETFGKVMQIEEQDLQEIRRAIGIATGAIREKNAEQIREILGDAKDALSDIGERRRDMSKAIEQAQQQVRQAREARPEAPERPDEPSEEEQEQRQQMIVGRVANILSKVRAMPEEEFRANRAQIAQAVLQAMTAPVPTPRERIEEDLSPEERVRQKMEMAGEIYRQLRDHPEADVSELDDTFSKVRDLLTEHEYERAEELVDEGVEQMREMARGLAPLEADTDESTPDGDTEGYGPQLRMDAPDPSLNLRGGDGEPPFPGPAVPGDAAADDVPIIPDAPDAAEITDDTEEGAEQ